MLEFSEEKFNDALKRYYQYRDSHPYYYLDWRTNGSIAKECKSLLQPIADGLRALVTVLVSDKENLKDFKIRISSGAAYFPRNPWIAVLFKGESPTDGIYPVFSFYDNDSGFLIGCTESIRNVQPDFSERYCRMERVADSAMQERFRSAGIEDCGHLALTSDTLIVRRRETFTESALVKAVKGAIDVYCEFRDKAGADGTQVHVDTTPQVAQVRNWYKTVQVDDFGKWFLELSELNMGREPHWVFRGQGLDKWGLESSLGRKVQYGENQVVSNINIGRELLRSEKVAIAEFAREARANPVYRDFDDIDLLALMQHYEGKTRLLDFSFSPLVALFWATRQNDVVISHVKGFVPYYEKEMNLDASEVTNAVDDASICVWAINLDDVLHEYPGGDLHAKMAESRCFAELTVGGGRSSGYMPNVYGVDVVRPQINNPRITVQDGLFLMARSLEKSFEENLIQSLPEQKRNVVDAQIGFDLRNCAGKFATFKFILKGKSADEARDFLSDLRITYQTVYPDLTGLARGVTERVIERSGSNV